MIIILTAPSAFLDQVRESRGGSVREPLPVPLTSPPQARRIQLPHGAFATALPPLVQAREGPQ